MTAQNNIAIRTRNLSKAYPLWDKPSHGMWHALTGGFGKYLTRKSKTPGNGKSSGCREFRALHPVNLEIRTGECFGIIGRNGSGKSTLLQLICNVLNPTTGDVDSHGKVAALLELGSGFNREFTGRENVYLNAAIHGLDKRQTDELFSSIEEFAEIGEFIDQKVKTYSSGMVVRLAFSVLVHLSPDILIIDEALAVGDAFFVQKCMRWLENFKQDKTVVLVSHDLSAITRFCDRVAWIDGGKIRYTGNPRRATELYLESMYSTSELDLDEADEEGATSGNTMEGTSDVMETPVRDARQDILQEPEDNIYNCVENHLSSPGFGEKSIEIIHVRLTEKDSDTYYGFIRGGEEVRLDIVIEAKKDADSPIIGFGLKNRHGQELFHDNTWLSSFTVNEQPISMKAGERAVGRFEFIMPYLPSGDYFLFAAVATGTHRDHQQQHWIHEAIKLTSASRRICLGLVGLPMLLVSLDRIENLPE